ncbi:hypothetical protein [Serinibacter arcticus]|uniref:hypothetical protein n=1 Tax=Serinibacter arcticus TaxID=1655435 RepID=UPI0018EEBAF4|nr:hypothetical protein [Serinibacter arcticus]
MSAAVVVLAVDEARLTWSWRARSGPVVLELEHGVDPAPSGTGTRTWLTIRGAAPVVLAYSVAARVALVSLVRRPSPST